MVKKQSDVCELFCYNKAKVNRLKRTLPSQKKITGLTDLFKALGDNTRAKILFSLAKGELCVCDIAHVLELSISAVSHQLRKMRGVGLAKYRNEGKMVFYSLDNEQVIKIVESTMKLIKK